MRCPRCGLVHPDGDIYCRRCQVNLHTGEPRPEEPTVDAIPASQRLLHEAETILRSLLAGARRLNIFKDTFNKMAAQLKSLNLRGMLNSLTSRSEKLKTIPCLQCEDAMKIDRIPVYGAGGPIALFILGGLLLGIGFLAWPLFITGVVSVGLAVFFRKRGKTRWRCPSCGYTVSRQT